MMKPAGNSVSEYFRTSKTANPAIRGLGVGEAADVQIDDRIMKLLRDEGALPANAIVARLSVGVTDAVQALERLEKFGFVKTDLANGQPVIAPMT